MDISSDPLDGHTSSRRRSPRPCPPRFPSDTELWHTRDPDSFPVASLADVRTPSAAPRASPRTNRFALLSAPRSRCCRSNSSASQPDSTRLLMHGNTHKASMPTGSVPPPTPSPILAHSHAVLHVPLFVRIATLRAIPRKNARFSIWLYGRRNDPEGNDGGRG